MNALMHVAAAVLLAAGNEPAAVRLACERPDPAELVTRIAFGSCAQQERAQPIWHVIADAEPDVFIFLGDNIYGDSDDAEVLRAKYAKLAAMPGLRRMCAEGTGVLATWDDHDFGRNDAGAEYPSKEASQRVFVDFFGTPAGAGPRTRPGVYDSVMLGPEGFRVQVILLDTRTFRTPLAEKGSWGEAERALGIPGPYAPVTDSSATLLGEAQWEWLRERLAEPASLRVIASSVQVASEEHCFEKWMNFPAERDRLIRLINDSRAGGVVFISGDRHHAEISRLADAGPPPAIDPRYPLFDVTSSALNQTKGWGNELNRHRLGSTFHEENFGLIEIDWSAEDPALSLEIRDVRGRTVIRRRVPFSELSAR
ncbi:MAG: alkaline phosphatase D family protein [Planctomycetota bacterium]|nr:alkaline phosphatase D family protein [Planctomycetota bacterium]